MFPGLGVINFTITNQPHIDARYLGIENLERFLEEAKTFKCLVTTSPSSLCRPPKIIV